MTAYEQGEAAYFRGEDHGDNPFKVGTKEREEWARGMDYQNEWAKSYKGQ